MHNKRICNTAKNCINCHSFYDENRLKKVKVQGRHVFNFPG